MNWLPIDGLPKNQPPADQAGRDGPRRATAQVIPLPRADARRFRRAGSPSEEPGRILLFTGVRYERRPDPAQDASPLQRRRS